MKKNTFVFVKKDAGAHFFKTKLICFCMLFVFVATRLAAQQFSVGGTVVDVTGEPIIGVNITEVGTTNGAITDLDGRFSLKVSSYNATVRFSYLGYITEEVSLGGKPVVSVVLKEDTKTLDEVVVVGYGTMRKKDLTGSVIQIKPDKIADEAPKSIQDIMRGTPGLKVGISTSAKGGGSLEIRGTRSVSGTSLSDPMIVLDGMPFDGDISEINPNDIGQIDVLKDASSAAVYGSKAANGVLIITTKKGKIGKPVVNLRINLGFDTKADYSKRYGPNDYMAYREEWYRTPTYGVNSETGHYEAYQTGSTPNGYYNRPDNLPAGVSLDSWRTSGAKQLSGDESDLSLYARRLDFDDVILANFLAGKSFDWYDYAFKTGFNQDYNISVSGASDRMNYYMSVGYVSNESSIRGDVYDAVRANLKLSGKVTNWFEISANVNFQDRKEQSLPINIGSTLNNNPYAGYKDSEGNLMVNPMGDKNPTFRGYNYDFEQQYLDLEKGWVNINSIFTAKLTLPFNVTYSFNVAPRYEFYYNRYFFSADHPYRTAMTGGVDREQGKELNWSLNNTINWDYIFAQKHHVNLTLVQEAEELKTWLDVINARNFQPTDALGFHNTQNAGKDESSFSTKDTHHTANGMLARLFYSYDDRYMLTTSIRRDGYSAFGANNPYATFPAVAVAWLFTNEKFFKWEPMSTGKLRFSWGKNGNRSLADPYISLSNLRNGTSMFGYLNTSNSLDERQYLIVERLGNSNLRWEKSAAYNVGLDFGFFNDRITGTLEGYVINTEDMILAKQLPGFTGFGSIATNLGQVQNKGFEFTISSQNMKTENFEWNTTLNLSYNKNKIKHLYYEYENVLDDDGNVIGTKERDEYGKWFIGKDIHTIWNYRVTGIWQTDEIEEAKKYGQVP